MRYFQQFPIIEYKNNLITDISKRVKIPNDAKNNATIYYQYLIRDGETIDGLAHDYYGDSYYFWVIALVNDMTDLYYDWPMHQSDFDSFIRKKYGTMEAAQGQIHHYERDDSLFYINQKTGGIITETAYLTLDSGQKSLYEQSTPAGKTIIGTGTYSRLPNDADEWTPVYCYDYEFKQNESKRLIKLLDLVYLPNIEDSLKELLK